MSVGLHVDWPVDKLQSILVESEVRCVIASAAGAQKIKDAVLLPARRGYAQVDPTQLKLLVLLDGDLETAGMMGNALAGHGITVRLWNEVLEAGKRARWTHTGMGFVEDTAAIDLADDDGQPFTLMFSSGSTGAPKGTACTKRNWKGSNCTEGSISLGGDLFDRRTVSYLSLSHGADRGIAWQTVFAGGKLGFARGEDQLEGMLEDLKDLRPTFFLGMANFWSTLHGRFLTSLNAELDAVLNTLVLEHLSPQQNEHNRHGTTETNEDECKKESGAAARALAISGFRNEPNWAALRQCLQQTRRGAEIVKRHLDATRTQLGGCLRLCATGGSRTPTAVREFMSWLLEEGNETRVTDAYGSTEFPGISSNGFISDGVELKLEPVMSAAGGDNTPLEPAVVYSPEDHPCPRGEILVRRTDGTRPSYYWKRPKLNAAAWDEDGWYRTGDVGQLEYRAIDAEGNSIMQPNTYQSKKPRCAYFSPKQDGGVMCKNPGAFAHDAPLLTIIDRVQNLEEIYLHGDSYWISSAELEASTYGELPYFEFIQLVSDRNEEGIVAIVVLSQNEFASGISSIDTHHDTYLQLLQSAGKAANRATHEIPVGVVVLKPHSWTIENGLLTITGKPKRSQVKLEYEELWMAEYQRTKQRGEDAHTGHSCKDSLQPHHGPVSSRDADVEQAIAELTLALDAEACGESGAHFSTSCPGRRLIIKRGSQCADVRMRVGKKVLVLIRQFLFVNSTTSLTS